MKTKHATLALFDVVFVSAVAFMATRFVTLTALDLVIIGLATFRLARSVSFNEIFEWLRRPFCKVKPDSCKAGSNVHPRYLRGPKAAIGGLLSCPICTGTWSALVLVSLWTLGTFGHYLVYVLAAAGISELVHYFGEQAEWQGRYYRVSSGVIAPDEGYDD